MNKKILFFIILAFVILLIIGFITWGSSSQPELTVDESKSMFFNFYEKDNRVYIDCAIAVKNYTDSDISFEMYAIMEKEVQLGLLTNSTVYALDDYLDKQIFSMTGNETKVFGVTFVGDYGGTFLKEDRNIPDDIRFHIVND